MKDTLIKAYKFNLLYAEELVADIDEKLMTKSPGAGLENHPAFTLGHLISGSAMMSEELGGPYEFKPEWEQLFRGKGPGDPRIPDTNPGLYPPKEELLAELTRQHKMVEDLIMKLDENKFMEPVQWRFDNHLPTLGDLVYFMCITHEAMHLSQLAAWRRAMGMPSAFAKL
jgi:hypothetical protein